MPNATAVMVPPARRAFAVRLDAASLPGKPHADRIMPMAGMSIATNTGSASTSPSARARPPTSAMGIWKPVEPAHSNAMPAIMHGAPNPMRRIRP